MKCIYFIIPILLSCSAKVDSLNEFDRERQILIAKGVSVSRGYEVLEDGSEELKAEIFYNDSGYVAKLALGLSSSNSEIEEYTYNEDNIAIETRRLSENGTMNLLYSKEYTSDGEIDKEFVEGHTFISEYVNDEQGRNLKKRYLKNDSLIATYQFFWSEHHQPDSIIGYSPAGARIGRLLNRFKNGNLVETEKYEHGTLTEQTKVLFNSRGLRVNQIDITPNDFRNETAIEYDDGLIAADSSTYTSLNSDYQSKTQLIWKHELKK